MAIRVSNLEASSMWYQDVLGLKKYTTEAWGEYPVFLLSGKSGIALFPADLNDKEVDRFSRNIKIDHLAFNVDLSEFEKAKAHLEQLGITYEFQDHTYFHSIYFNDPDGHKLELTTLVVEESEFY